MSQFPIHIDTAFDSGNINVLSIDGAEAKLAIHRDAHSDFFQWFHFRVSGVAGANWCCASPGLNAAAYPGRLGQLSGAFFRGPRLLGLAQTSWDAKADNGTLTITHTPDGEICWFAYFAPYSMERHHDLIAQVAGEPGVIYRRLGTSLDGQPIDCLTMGEGPVQIWLQARQHPGETMAEWWMEGALTR
jgi:murein tripeptide amidase MpaA